MQMVDSPVMLKASKNELRIIMSEDASFEEIKKHLAEQMGHQSFFRGACMEVKIVGRTLSPDEEHELQQLILSKGLTILNSGDSVISKRSQASMKTQESSEPEQANHSIDGTKSLLSPDAQIIHRTVRSGVRVVSPYTLVIMGDVNPGAEVISEQDIYVWGTLRGKAHAGYPDDRNARIVAFRILASQVAIADCIAKSPPEDTPSNEGPEIAYICEQDGRLIIEIAPYRS